MSSAERVSLTRRVAGPPSTVFRLITDPAMHVEIDGSGMLEAAPDAKPLTAVGDTFDIDMDREPLGDLPMGKYKVRNTVTKITPDAELEWNIGGIDMPPVGHVYGYTLEAVGDETDVTLYCDWTDAPDQLKQAREWPIVPVSMLEKSMDNLERLAANA
jgi:hypothetical protein